MNTSSSSPAPDFRALSQSLRQSLRRIRRWRQVVRVLTCTVYGATLAWFVFCLFGGYLSARLSLQQNYNLSLYILIGFVVFCLLQQVFVKSFQVLNRQETQVMTHLVARLFPDARYLPTGLIDLRVVADSRLFDFSVSAQQLQHTTGYGRIDLPCGKHLMSVADIGITPSRTHRWLYEIPVLNYFTGIYQYLIRPIFGTRIESTMHSFRGMFGCCETEQSFRSGVILLPDHLEMQLGYLAPHIQRLKERYGNRLVRLEDPEFERLFAVYATDEVEARRVLTPAMMQRICQLRRSFSRDLMLSFHGHRLCFAAETPDGFLRPGRRSLDDEKLVEQLYHEINFCRTLAGELKIE